MSLVCLSSNQNQGGWSWGGEGRGVEGNEAERPGGQVVRSLVGLYKNLNLTLEELENHWGISHGSYVIGLKFEEDPCRVESGSSEMSRDRGPGTACCSGPVSHGGVCTCVAPWVDRSSLEHEWLALLRFLWSLHQKSWIIKSLGICVGLTPHPSSLSELWGQRREKVEMKIPIPNQVLVTQATNLILGLGGGSHLPHMIKDSLLLSSLRKLQWF